MHNLIIMKKEVSLIIRVLLTISILLIPAYFLQQLLQDITIQATYKVISLIEPSPWLGAYSISHAIQLSDGTTINIVKYCVTSSAYYFLAILAVITKGIPITKRIGMFLLGAVSIFIMNVFRIFILIKILVGYSPDLFQLAHTTLSAILSIFYVIIVWILLSLIFKVKTVPIYSDVKDLIKNENN